MIRYRLLHMLAGLTLAAIPAAAHEFWIDPAQAHPTLPDTVTAQLRVGQDMLGEPFPWLSRSIVEAWHRGPDGTEAITGREGDLPALSVSAEAPGLHRISLATHPAYIVFEDMDAFADYLAYEGLSAVLARHRARGLPETEIAEAYIRNARTLIQVGPANAAHRDAPSGMPLELVALKNPYLDGVQALPVQLLWQGVPEAGTQLSVFHLPPGGTAPDDVVRRLYATGPDGVAEVPLAAGKYLLNAVHMEPSDGPGSVVWQSHWASLTFTVPAL